MNNKEFLNELSRKTALQGKETAELAQVMVKALTDHLTNGNIVNISGFGSLEVKKKQERVSVNPKTGKRMLVPPKLTPAFKPSVTLKDKFK